MDIVRSLFLPVSFTKLTMNKATDKVDAYVTIYLTLPINQTCHMYLLKQMYLFPLCLKMYKHVFKYIDGEIRIIKYEIIEYCDI